MNSYQKQLEMRPDEQREILIYAFRYALGRSSYSVSTVSKIILDNWDIISESDKKLFNREILEAQETNNIGMEMDARSWMKIVNKYEGYNNAV